MHCRQNINGYGGYANWDCTSYEKKWNYKPRSFNDLISREKLRSFKRKVLWRDKSRLLPPTPEIRRWPKTGVKVKLGSNRYPRSLVVSCVWNWKIDKTQKGISHQICRHLVWNVEMLIWQWQRAWNSDVIKQTKEVAAIVWKCISCSHSYKGKWLEGPDGWADMGIMQNDPWMLVPTIHIAFHQEELKQEHILIRLLNLPKVVWKACSMIGGICGR